MSSITPTFFLLLVAAATAASRSSEWTKYKLKHEKIYSGKEDLARMKIWEMNVEMVEKHNREKHSYTMKVNKFSDWTEEEFKKFIGYHSRPVEREDNVEVLEFSLTQNVKTNPNVVDYRKEGKVTPVKDQGKYDPGNHNHGNYGWAFSATGAMEGMLANDTGKLVPLSEQQLIDCCPRGCESLGGKTERAWQYVKNAGGILWENHYFYTGQNGTCKFDDELVVDGAKVGGIKKVPADEIQLESTLAEIGYPITVGLATTQKLMHYSGGVFDDRNCNNGRPDHVALVVGYDYSDFYNKYWIVKNSWGTEWGEEGYIRMKMGMNICGIVDTRPSYPTSTQTPGPSVCFEPGECQHSFLVGEIPMDSANECLESCKEMLRCQWFSFFPDISACALFSNCEVLNPAECPECLTGHKECPRQPYCDIEAQCMGIFLHGEKTMSSDACLTECINQSSCQWFTWDGRDDACFLFEDCVLYLDNSCPMCISGQRDCHVQEI